jgi:exodeoxyribonuclease-3
LQGYAGSAAFVRKDGVKPLKVTFGIGHPKHDQEGRSITLEYPSFYLVALYVPNSGLTLRLFTCCLNYMNASNAIV